MREHVAIIERQIGKTPEEFIFPACPDVLWYVWDMFLDLCKSRTNTGYGALPLSYAEIQCWSQLTRCDVTPQEVAMLRSLDSLFMQGHAKG